MSFNDIRENKILAKISEFTVGNSQYSYIKLVYFQKCIKGQLFVLFVCFVVPVNSYGHGGQSVHLTTLFPGQA